MEFAPGNSRILHVVLHIQQTIVTVFIYTIFIEKFTMVYPIMVPIVFRSTRYIGLNADTILI